MRTIQLNIALALLLTSYGNAFSQDAPKYESISEEIMRARFQSLQGGRPIRLVTSNKKVIVLTLWASWCGPCRFVVIELKHINRDLAARGVAVIGLSNEEHRASLARIRRFVRRSRIRYPLGWVDTETATSLGGGRSTIPQILILSPEGRVLNRFVGWDPIRRGTIWREAVEKVLDERP